jgi:hypothetical protein
MTNGPFTPSNGRGRIAADLYDFRHHVEGTAFKHAASQITTAPGVGGATDAQASFNNINTFIASLADKGTAFIAVPDGYNCYSNPAPNFYFSNTIPPLNNFLTPLFAAIVAGGAMPAGYSRLTKGGILYIPAGTYYITNSVTVPPGITLLGEGYATKIINATSLDLTVTPPLVNGSGTPKPVFIIKNDANRSSNDDAIDSDNTHGSFMFSRVTKFINFIIADNFVEPTSLGDLNYKLPQNTTGDTPLVMQLQGSNFEAHNMYMVGKATTTGTAVDAATRFCFKLDTVTITPGSHFRMKDCFVDGFSQPISFNSSSGVSDYLLIHNNKVRSHGYLNADGSGAENNCVIHMNDNNAIITDNYFYCNHNLLNRVCYVKNVRGSVPTAGNLSSIVATGNEVVVGRGTLAISADIIIVDGAIANTFNQYCYILSYGNNTESGFSVITTADATVGLYVDKNTASISSLSIDIIGRNSMTVESTATGSVTNINAGGSVNLNAGTGNVNLSGLFTHFSSAIVYRPIVVNTATYNIDSAIRDHIILVDTVAIGASCLIKLPSPLAGRSIIIKDRTGIANTNNIKVYGTNTDNIDGVVNSVGTPVIFSANWGSWSFVGDGTNWLLL